MLEEIYSRRSIRKYTSEPISRSIIEKIIDAGRVAPSAKNRQPWKYLVYSGEAKARLLSIMKKGIECQTAHCGRSKPHIDFCEYISPIVPYRNLPQTLRGLTADCCSPV